MFYMSSLCLSGYFIHVVSSCCVFITSSSCKFSDVLSNSVMSQHVLIHHVCFIFLSCTTFSHVFIFPSCNVTDVFNHVRCPSCFCHVLMQSSCHDSQSLSWLLLKIPLNLTLKKSNSKTNDQRAHQQSQTQMHGEKQATADTY